jgi:hypothetical protein
VRRKGTSNLTQNETGIERRKEDGKMREQRNGKKIRLKTFSLRSTLKFHFVLYGTSWAVMSGGCLVGNHGAKALWTSITLTPKT